MSEYKGIKGFQVQTRTEDPAPFAQALADNPYAGAWSSGGSLNTARNFLSGSGAGTLTSSIAFGGDTGSNSALTENYNGTSWTEVNDLNTARNGMAGFGTATAALAVDSRDPLAGTAVESWDGSSWTEIAENNTGKSVARGFGVQTAGNVIGGTDNTPGSEVLNLNEYWNGSSWTELNDLNTARHSMGASGVYTAGLAAGGYNGTANVAVHEQWNGSTWTESTDLNTARRGVGSSGPSSTAALISGGYTTTYSSVTEDWNGSAWTEVADLATGREQHHGSGSSTSGLAFGGSISPGRTAATEEWTFSGVQPGDEASYADAITGDFYYNSTTGQFKTVNTGGAPIGTWASGGAMNSAKRLQGGSGSSNTAALVFGGRQIPGTNVTETESYDGTSFTEVADLSRTNEKAYIAGAGTQTAALAIGGAPPGVLGLTEQWNGSAWTEVADLNRGPAGPQSTAYGAGSGSYTSALYSSSDEGGNLNDRVESWNGSSWTEVSEVNTARSYATQAGTDNTSAILAGGYSTTNVANVETWDGSSWSEITDINTARMRLSSGMQGSTESMLIFSGYTTDSVANTENWNGSTWTEVNDMATARRSGTGSGVSTSAFQAGGQTGPSAPTVLANNEEFTAADFQIKTVTTS